MPGDCRDQRRASCVQNQVTFTKVTCLAGGGRRAAGCADRVAVHRQREWRDPEPDREPGTGKPTHPLRRQPGLASVPRPRSPTAQRAPAVAFGRLIEQTEARFPIFGRRLVYRPLPRAGMPEQIATAIRAKMKNEELNCNANSTWSSNVTRKATISLLSRKSLDATRKRGPWTKLRRGSRKQSSCALTSRVRPNRVWSLSGFSASRSQRESKAADHGLGLGRRAGKSRVCCHSNEG